jgi:hypothetical protein
MTLTNYNTTATSSADYGFDITPSDTLDLPRVTREVYSASGGVVKWHNMLGEAQTTTIPIDGTRAIKARRILATGTTATGLEGLA